MMTNFAMVQHHKYSLTELENMIPWERDIYVSLLLNYVQEENQRLELQRQQKGWPMAEEEKVLVDEISNKALKQLKKTLLNDWLCKPLTHLEENSVEVSKAYDNNDDNDDEE